MLETYLRDLERDLSRTLSDDDVRTRLLEAEAHIKEGIEGRIELGLDLAEAERETIAAFGHPCLIARSIIRQARIGRNAVRVRWLFALYAVLFGYSLWMVTQSTGGGILWMLSLGITTIGFAAASFRSRRPAPVLTLSLNVLLIAVGNMVICEVLKIEGERLTPQRLLEAFVWPAYLTGLDLFFGTLGFLTFKFRRNRSGGFRA